MEQGQGVHSYDQRGAPLTSLALDQRVTSISQSGPRGPATGPKGSMVERFSSAACALAHSAELQAL